jgi:hypothetical protein
MFKVETDGEQENVTSNASLSSDALRRPTNTNEHGECQQQQ